MSERTERAKSTIKGVVAPDAAEMQAAGVATAPLGTSENPSNAILTVANFITMTRLVLTIVFLVLFVANDPNTRITAIMFYAIAACTDFLDGQVARRTQTVSWLGKVMDPIMDRVLLFTGVLGLMITGELPVWVAVVVIGRDIVLAAGTAWLRKFQTRPLDVIYIGKVATALLMSGFVDLLIDVPHLDGLGLVDVPWLPGLNGESAALGIYLVYVGVVCSVITAVIYYRKGLAIRRRVLDARKGE